MIKENKNDSLQKFIETDKDEMRDNHHSNQFQCEYSLNNKSHFQKSNQIIDSVLYLLIFN
jgi:hypothetical protein